MFEYADLLTATFVSHPLYGGCRLNDIAWHVLQQVWGQQLYPPHPQPRHSLAANSQPGSFTN